MAHAVGYERVIFGTSPDGGNSHAAANRQGIPAILVETGKLGDRDPATVRRLLDALYRLLHHLGAIGASEHIKQPTVQPREWIWTGDVESPAAGLWYPDACHRRRGHRGTDHRPHHRPGRRHRAQDHRQRHRKDRLQHERTLRPPRHASRRHSHPAPLTGRTPAHARTAASSSMAACAS
ncbi:succinylglutamate desuccinylase/aspartoacylase family protein [Streptomyces sp. S.PNR 29]|uniref:succinylglutamate desuccinylase/aspartoacylase domain-containing protein n=1 Tax=Streptomyces sp. S.PNR 29 TaxID=2973805 RepID=UPI0025B27B04|nr:succinylglutamate desuccinylase/aspartoacylase family protein [Streptomyces sp. S.PNR 29]MDN0199108.1 succinylglutamate desuccinylase/aspartoacylase family protein [Streptomyces sp. S.PNR 29]